MIGFNCTVSSRKELFKSYDVVLICFAGDEYYDGHSILKPLFQLQCLLRGK